MVFDLVPGEPSRAVGVVNGEGCLLTKSKVLAFKEVRYVVFLCAILPMVGAGSGALVRAFADFFLDSMAALGKKVVLDKV